MKKGIRYSVAAAAVFGGLAFGQAGTASAAHCTAPAGEESQPGFSYFGTDHVQEDAHDREGGNPAPHNDNPGASNCRETTGSPSVRAPGKD